MLRLPIATLRSTYREDRSGVEMLLLPIWQSLQAVLAVAVATPGC